uniref:RP1 axonemal microtubule associated n=1 Tax=Paramormyrops kingsleyae TaxID=1676925 RepID=A0A3B3SGL7_9TELE
MHFFCLETLHYSPPPPPHTHTSSGSTLTMGSRHPYLTEPIASKRVSFYKSGDPQFSALRMVINSRTFKTFDALLDSLSKKVPLPFGVRNITTPHGVHPVRTLEELEDGKAYICSDQKKVKPFDLEMAGRRLPPWYHARPISARSRTLQLTNLKDGRFLVRDGPALLRTPKRLTVFRNGDPGRKHTVILARKTTPTFDSLLDHVSEVLRFHVVKLYTSDGRRVNSLPALIMSPGILVAAGRENFKPGSYSIQKPAPRTRRRLVNHQIKKNNNGWWEGGKVTFCQGGQNFYFYPRLVNSSLSNYA